MVAAAHIQSAGLLAASSGYQLYTMMSAGRFAFAWSPHDGGQIHENTHIDAYCENNQHDQRYPGDYRDPFKPARPIAARRAGPVIGRDTRRRS